MATVLTGLQGRAGAAAGSVRRRVPALDHLVRAYTRYVADTGDRLAAGVTYFGFLSFFPLVVLAVSVLGFVLADNDAAIREVQRQLEAFAPGLAHQLPIPEIVAARQGLGVLGLAGLLYAGLGWVDALREAIRTVWHHNVKAGNFVVRKLLDVTILAGLGLTLAASVAASGLVTSATTWLLGLVGLVDVAVFVYLFIRLPRLTIPWRRVVKGAVFAAVGFEVLKYAGAFYVQNTTRNPVYGTFAVVVGLLIWITPVSRFLLFAAAWTVTAPYDTDVAPSGTAGPREAEKAGVPKEFAEPDADGVWTLQERGAPSPLRAALQGKPGVGLGDEERGEGSATAKASEKTADARAGGGVRTAGRLDTGALGGGAVPRPHPQAEEPGGDECRAPEQRQRWVAGRGDGKRGRVRGRSVETSGRKSGVRLGLHQRAHRPRAPTGREPPVEQPRGLVPYPRLRPEQGHHERPVAAPGGPDETRPSGRGEAVLHSQGARIPHQQPVVGVDLEPPPARRREVRAARRHVAAEVGQPQPGAGDEGEVVGGRRLAGDVEATGRAGDGVQRAELPCPLVHRRDDRRAAAGRLREHVGGVVAGHHHQGAEQVVDVVAPPRDDADLAAVDVGIRGRRGDQLRRRQTRDQRERGEDLQRARRRVAAVRVLRGEDRARVEVGDDVRRRADRGRPGGAGRHADDETPAAEQVTADGPVVVPGRPGRGHCGHDGGERQGEDDEHGPGPAGEQRHDRIRVAGRCRRGPRILAVSSIRGAGGPCPDGWPSSCSPWRRGTSSRGARSSATSRRPRDALPATTSRTRC